MITSIDINYCVYLRLLNETKWYNPACYRENVIIRDDGNEVDRYVRSEGEKEIANRIKVALYSYAYEIMNKPLTTDAEYDALARSIRPLMVTGKPLEDWFFEEQFSPNTGQWIHKHPNLDGIASLYDKFAAQIVANKRS